MATGIGDGGPGAALPPIRRAQLASISGTAAYAPRAEPGSTAVVQFDPVPSFIAGDAGWLSRWDSIETRLRSLGIHPDRWDPLPRDRRSLCQFIKNNYDVYVARGDFRWAFPHEHLAEWYDGALWEERNEANLSLTARYLMRAVAATAPASEEHTAATVLFQVVWANLRGVDRRRRNNHEIAGIARGEARAAEAQARRDRLRKQFLRMFGDFKNFMPRLTIRRDRSAEIIRHIARQEHSSVRTMQEVIKPMTLLRSSDSERSTPPA